MILIGLDGWNKNWVVSKLKCVECMRRYCTMVRWLRNVIQDVQKRVDTALSAYERGNFTECSSSNIKNEELERHLVNEFCTASVEIPKEARTAVMEMFTSKAIENEHLWRGLVEAQSKNHEQSLKKSITEVGVALDTTIKEKVVDVVNARGVA